MVCVKVGQEHLVERVDRQFQAREVRQRPASEIEDEEVALGIADLDEDTA